LAYSWNLLIKAMNSKKDSQSKAKLEREIDKLEEMWDAMFAKGDDEYYETARNFRGEDNKEVRKAKPRRRGKRI